MASPIYRPLDPWRDEIRLLEIRSIEPQIELSLITTTLSDELYYSALSYVWGDASDTEPILVNGSVFHATKNLARALRTIPKLLPKLAPGGHTLQAFRLWVDAICINQQDVAEKNHEVGRMHLVYSSAASVLSWTGLHEIDDLSHSNALDIIGLIYDGIKDVVGIGDALPAGWLARAKHLSATRYDEPAHGSVIGLASAPY